MQKNNIISLVKNALADHQEKHGKFIDDKDYEQWFVKYYVYYMDETNLLKSTTPTHTKNGIR